MVLEGVGSSYKGLGSAVSMSKVFSTKNVGVAVASPKPREMMKLIIVAVAAGLLGAFLSMFSMQYGLISSSIGIPSTLTQVPDYVNFRPVAPNDMEGPSCTRDKPQGTEPLPPGIIHIDSDLFPRRLWGKPEEDLPVKPKYLVTLTVGVGQKAFINEQVKRWYVKRFLHPDVVEPYEYIFVWDEDLDLKHFNALRYIELVKKYALEISQPSLDGSRGTTWAMTKHRGDVEVHKETVEHPGWCPDPLKPPCAGFVEIMAPVFSRKAWRCIWYIIQNDLIHGWGLDFALRRCVEPAYERIGVVDEQWIIHVGVPSLGNQGDASGGRAPWEGVRERCRYEWGLYTQRWKAADEKQAALDAAGGLNATQA